MLSWSRARLAESAKVAQRTVVDFERGARRPYDRTLLDIRRALEEGGVEFVEGDGKGPGVRLRTPIELL